jgi:uncharacterized protein YbaP (TraB family)
MIFKKIFITLIIAWFTVGMLCSQEKTGSTTPSFLWQVESKAIKTATTPKSYLLGSIHFLKKEHYPLKKVIEEAFDQADVLAVEVDISSDKIAKAGMMLMQKGMYSGEETLKANISEKTFQLARDKLKELGMDISGFQTFKPWMVAMSIINMELMKLGFNPNYGIDKYFLDKVSESTSAPGKKEIVELEGVEYQVKLFESFSKEEGEKFLLSSVMEANQWEKELDNLVNAWSTGDTEKMEQLLTQNIQKYPELNDLYKKLLDDRNEKMVEKIISYLKTGKTYFIVVGAAHMVGKKGIVQLLKEKGLKVKQL